MEKVKGAALNNGTIEQAKREASKKGQATLMSPF